VEDKMATVRTCDKCGRKGQPGTADIRQIIVPESPVPGAKEKKVDLCQVPGGCMEKLFVFLGDSVMKADDAPSAKTRREVNGGE
jgi:hypothetical protein